MNNPWTRLAAVAAAVGLAVTAMSSGPSSAHPSALAGLPHPHVMPIDVPGREKPLVSLPIVGVPPTPTPLISGGGPILASPKVYLVFWGWGGQDTDGVRAKMIDFFSGVGGSAWQGVTTQYDGTVNGQQVQITNPVGQLAGTWDDDTNAIHNNLSFQELAEEAGRAVAHFNGGTPDANANYFVATPKNFNDAQFNQQQYCAWHDYTTASSYPGVTPGIAFTNMPYVLNMGTSCGRQAVNAGTAGFLDGVTIVAGHEYLEAVTDPDVSTGWTDLLFNENADKCAWVKAGPGKMTNVTLSSGTFAVQGTWSNKDLNGLGACATS
ncbi:MAG: hypothetical protein QOG03_89 [Actinomycetota bacterium]|nr:hypothetical protein [Actinomycetota bacterium]